MDHVSQRLNAILCDVLRELESCAGLLPAIRLERLNFLGKEADLDRFLLVAVGDAEQFVGIILLSLDSELKNVNEVLNFTAPLDVVLLGEIEVLHHWIKRAMLLPKALEVAVETLYFLHSIA